MGIVSGPSGRPAVWPARRGGVKQGSPHSENIVKVSRQLRAEGPRRPPRAVRTQKARSGVGSAQRMWEAEKYLPLPSSAPIPSLPSV